MKGIKTMAEEKTGAMIEETTGGTAIIGEVATEMTIVPRSDVILGNGNAVLQVEQSDHS